MSNIWMSVRGNVDQTASHWLHSLMLNQLVQELIACTVAASAWSSQQEFCPRIKFKIRFTHVLYPESLGQQLVLIMTLISSRRSKSSTYTATIVLCWSACQWVITIIVSALLSSKPVHIMNSLRAQFQHLNLQIDFFNFSKRHYSKPFRLLLGNFISQLSI